MKVLTGRQRRGNILSLGGTLPTTLDLNHPGPPMLATMLPITAKAEGCVIVYYLLNYPSINSCPNFCICHLKTKNPGVAWLRDLKRREFWCKHIISKISKLLRPFTSVEDVSTKYSFQTYEHFNIAFLRGQI